MCLNNILLTTMSDQSYNRKQGAQKYWAMFRRERRKIQENKLRVDACQVPTFDPDVLFYPQLVLYSNDQKYPATAVYSEMFAFVEDLYSRATEPRDNMQAFSSFFTLANFESVVSMITAAKNITYMEKVRLRNCFPGALTQKEFGQWGVLDRFPHVQCNIDDNIDEMKPRQWCSYDMFRVHYDNMMTVVEFVDTSCKNACRAVEDAQSIQSAAFRHYIDVKRKYSEIVRRVHEMHAERVHPGRDEFKSIKDWALELKFDVDASYKLLYKTVSVDDENREALCADGKDCLSSKHPIMKLALDIDPHNVSLSSLKQFLNKNLRPSVEGSAAKSLAIKESVVNIRKQAANLLMKEVQNCKADFTSFVSLWKSLVCSDTLTNPLPEIIRLEDSSIYQRVLGIETLTNIDLASIEGHHVLSQSNAKVNAQNDIEETVDRNNNNFRPLRRLYEDARRTQKQAEEELRRKNIEEKELRRKRERRSLAKQIADRTAKKLVENMKQDDEKYYTPSAPELPPIAEVLPDLDERFQEAYNDTTTIDDAGINPDIVRQVREMNKTLFDERDPYSDIGAEKPTPTADCDNDDSEYLSDHGF